MVDCQNETPKVFRQVIRVDGHTLHADVVQEKGGQGSAPGPHEYFDTSLAACKALTAMWYAREKGLALESVEAHVERDASKELEGTYKLKVRLAFFGPLSAADKERIYRAIGHCPIHKLMTTTEVVIETEPLAV